MHFWYKWQPKIFVVGHLKGRKIKVSHCKSTLYQIRIMLLQFLEQMTLVSLSLKKALSFADKDIFPGTENMQIIKHIVRISSNIYFKQ